MKGREKCARLCWQGREGARRCRLSLSISLFAALALFVGLFLDLYISHTFRPTLISQIVCDRKECDAGGTIQWESFVNVPFTGGPQLFESFVFFNLTNLDQVRNGGKPVYKEVGPFSYKEFRSKLDVNFYDDGNRVSYKVWMRFEFDASESAADAMTSQITSLNPAYMGVLEETGGELQLTVAITGPILRDCLTFLTTEFAWNVISASVPPLLKTRQAALTTNSSTAFFTLWADAVSVPSDAKEWRGMLLSEFNDHRPTGISVKASSRLWDAAEQYSLVNLSAISTRAWTSPNAATRAHFSNLFDLTATQVDILVDWRAHFMTEFAEPLTLEQLNVSTVADIGWKQWCDGVPNGGVSVLETYPEIAAQEAWGMSPEIGIWGFVFQDLATAKELLNGTYGIFDPQNMGLYAQVVITETNYTKAKEMWGLSPEQERFVSLYLTEATVKLSDPRLHLVFEQGGGLFATHTAHEWLWELEDPLLKLLRPTGKVRTNFLKNQTKQEALAQPADHFFTGKSDVSLIAWYTEWQGKSTVDGVYRDPVKVECTNEWGLFPPFLKPYQRLCTFNTDYARPIEMVPVGTTTKFDIDMIRFMLANDTWAVNAAYYQSIQGFANMTGLQHAPVFQSNPHMFGVPEKWRAKFGGVRDPDSRDLTFIDIEPLTGKVLVARKMLQVNVFARPNLEFNFYNLGVPTDMFYPTLWAMESATVNEESADLLKRKVFLPLKLQQIGKAYVVPIAATLLIIGLAELVLVCIAFRRQSSPGYTVVASINSDDDAA